MKWGFVGHLRILRWHPITAGVVVGFFTGLMGLFAVENPLGGLVGAVGCGIIVAYLCEERLFTTIVCAAIADVLSSIVFFCLVLVAYLMMVALTEGFSFIFAVWFTMWYVVVGGTVAVIIGSISVVITGISATVTTLVMR